jgi:hypothetical protein
MKFSQREIEDLVVSWIVLGISFAVLREGVSSLVRNPTLIVQFLIIVGTAFVLHECHISTWPRNMACGRNIESTPGDWCLLSFWP